MLPIELTKGALEDFQDSLDWYVVHSESAAIAFDEAVQATLAKIAANPTRYAIIDEPFRACSMRPYPFRIVFTIEPDRILVSAIAHHSRRRSYWRLRGD